MFMQRNIYQAPAVADGTLTGGSTDLQLGNSDDVQVLALSTSM